MINRGLKGLVEGHPALDQVIEFDRGKMRANCDRDCRRFGPS